MNHRIGTAGGRWSSRSVYDSPKLPAIHQSAGLRVPSDEGPQEWETDCGRAVVAEQLAPHPDIVTCLDCRRLRARFEVGGLYGPPDNGLHGPGR